MQVYLIQMVNTSINNGPGPDTKKMMKAQKYMLIINRYGRENQEI